MLRKLNLLGAVGRGKSIQKEKRRRKRTGGMRGGGTEEGR